MFCPTDPATLADWLACNNIDSSSWGRGGAKSVQNLWEEIQRGESILIADPPRRVVRVAQVWVRKGNLLLVEMMQRFNDGSMRIVNNPPAEKMLPSESPYQAALRCLFEELQISPDEVMAIPQRTACLREDKPSPSYPGLHSFYVLYQVHVAVGRLPSKPFTTSELNRSTHDPVVLHHWEWYPIAVYQSRYSYVRS